MTAGHPSISPTASVIRFAAPISLPLTCAPVAWAAGRWPNEEWRDGLYWWVGYDEDAFAWRSVGTHPDGVEVTGSGDAASHARWLGRVFAPAPLEDAASDPVVARIAKHSVGMAALCNGSLFDGAVMSIVGQSISLASAGITAGRLAALFHPGMELAGRRLWPLPNPTDLAAADPAFVRRSGVTGKRAEALVRLGRAFANGEIADHPGGAVGEAATALLTLPGVGPWTVASALLWGLGEPDAFPAGDAALLRAARRAYGDPVMDHAALNRRAETWRPTRAVAARLLWLDLFGPAPDGG